MVYGTLGAAQSRDSQLGTSLLCFYLYLLCYAAVLINFTYYACSCVRQKLEEYIHTCSKINEVLSMSVDCSIRVYLIVFRK